MIETSDANTVLQKHTFTNLGNIGSCYLPQEFSNFTGDILDIEMHDAQSPPSELLDTLAKDKALIMTGDYAYIDGIFRYCQRHQRKLVSSKMFKHILHKGKRKAAFTEERRRKLHRLLMAMQGDQLLHITNAPDTLGLQRWFEHPRKKGTFLIPVRRFQRIITDMKRAHEGLPIQAMDQKLKILPHVYVPTDQSVPTMFAKFSSLFNNRHVLDMGTGTGVLALLAAHWGAASVVATDINANAVKNARLNISQLGYQNQIDVRDPANLFDAIQNETFDVILFNAPWILGEPQTRYDVALYDP